MKIKKLPLGLLQANCYIVTDEKTGETAVIDPGMFAGALQNEIDKIGAHNIKYILLTHGHFDHILGADELKSYTGAKVVVSKEDAELIVDSEKNGAVAFFGSSYSNMKISDADIKVSDGDEIIIGDTVIKVLSTPGHTPGGVCYMTDDVIFTGDTLFSMGCGRCDLYGGDYLKIRQSLKKIAAIDGDRKVYSGHGSDSTISYERANNPELEE